MSKKTDVLESIAENIYDIKQVIFYMFDVCPELKQPGILHELFPTYELLKSIQMKLAGEYNVFYDADDGKTKVVKGKEWVRLSKEIIQEFECDCAKWKREGFVWDLGTDKGSKAFTASRRKFDNNIIKAFLDSKGMDLETIGEVK
jgi:hypothetical protein